MRRLPARAHLQEPLEMAFIRQEPHFQNFLRHYTIMTHLMYLNFVESHDGGLHVSRFKKRLHLRRLDGNWNVNVFFYHFL